MLECKSTAKERMFRYRKGKGESESPGSLKSTHVYIDEDTFKAVSTFSYLGSVIGELGVYVVVIQAGDNTEKMWVHRFSAKPKMIAVGDLGVQCVQGDALVKAWVQNP